jgi:hypothetical protein
LCLEDWNFSYRNQLNFKMKMTQLGQLGKMPLKNGKVYKAYFMFKNK